MPDRSGELVEHVELRRLQHFLSVAENGGFTRAAGLLHLSQQALSSSIAKLEAQLGVALFDRRGRRVGLTGAGEVLRDGAPLLLAAARLLARQVRAAEAGRPHELRIGHTPAITAEEVHSLLDPVRTAMPAAAVTVHQMFPDALQPTLLDGTIDVALRRGIAAPDGFAARIVAYHPLRVAVPRTHRLAGRGSLGIRELRAEPVIVWAPPGTSFYTDLILSTCRSAGFEPAVVVNHIQGTPPTTAVVDNDGVAFVTAPPGPCHRGRVVVVELDEPPLVPVQAIWLPHTHSPMRELFTDGAKRDP